MNNLLKIFVFIAVFQIPSFAFAREIVDMRGKTITIPDKIEKIATLDDGFVENILTHIGEIDKVKVIGSWSMKRDYSYTFPTVDGEDYTLKGLNTMYYLYPHLNDLTCVNSPQGNVINYEALAAQNPDVVIMRMGDCTVRADNIEAATRSINQIEALGLPLVVLHTPQFDEEYNLSSMKEEARVIASVFGEEEVQEASMLMDYVSGIENMIRERVADIPREDKKTVLYLGLNPVVREEGGAGNVHGVNTPQSFMIEQVVNAKNAYKGKGTNVPVNAEQIYAFDPDIILLPTMNGYHPSKELYTAPYYSLLNNVRAVKDKKAYALPWTPMNCAPRLEYPLELLIMAKAIYPEKFKDIVFHEFATDFYKKIYHVDDKTAEGLLDTQILTWTKEEGF